MRRNFVVYFEKSQGCLCMKPSCGSLLSLACYAFLGHLGSTINNDIILLILKVSEKHLKHSGLTLI